MRNEKDQEDISGLSLVSTSRTHDPDTSHAAAGSVPTEEMLRRRRKISALIRFKPTTSFWVEKKLEGYIGSVSGIRTAISLMEDDDLIRKGPKVPNPSLRKAYVLVGRGHPDFDLLPRTDRAKAKSLGFVMENGNADVDAYRRALKRDPTIDPDRPDHNM